jgi:hypothetical protein
MGKNEADSCSSGQAFSAALRFTTASQETATVSCYVPLESNQQPHKVCNVLFNIIFPDPGVST